MLNDNVEAHCYVVTTNEYIHLDEHMRSRINQSIATDCRTFWSCMPSSTAYNTHSHRSAYDFYKQKFVYLWFGGKTGCCCV